jgi:sugar lactone lactonase YvrE
MFSGHPNLQAGRRNPRIETIAVRRPAAIAESLGDARMYRSLLVVIASSGMLVPLLSFLPLALGADAPPPGAFKPMAQESIVPADAKLELLWSEGTFTEGPVATADGTILFSDIGDRIMQFNPATGKTTVFRSPSGKSNGLHFDPAGRLVACEGAGPGGGRRISITENDGKVRTLADRYQGKRLNSPNDLAVTGSGAVYFTDPRYGGDEPRELDFEGVFLIDSDGAVHLATRDVEKPNGILVAPDGTTVYVSDNNNVADGNHQLLAFAVQADGTLADKRVLFDFGPNRRGIDGMTLDQQGNIYATAGRDDEAGVYVFSADGKPLAFVATPGGPTNCTFGTGDESSTLYITAGTDQPVGAAGRPPYGLYRIRLKNDGYRVFPKS